MAAERDFGRGADFRRAFGGDGQAAAAITLAPDNAASAGADEDEVPPAPDNVDAATDTPAQAQAGTEGAQGTDDQEIVEAPPQDTAPAETPTITTPSTATTGPEATGLSNVAAAAAAATTPATPATAPAATTTQQVATAAAPPAPPPAPAVAEDSLPKGQDYGVTNGQSRVILVARQEAWVQVSSATQEVWTRVLRSGDRYLVPNDPTLTLSTGNAGGLDIMVGEAFQGRGIGRRALALSARLLFEERDHHRITIDPAAANERAIRCYAAVGFRPVGILRRYERAPDGTWEDGLLMDLLADELVLEFS